MRVAKEELLLDKMKQGQVYRRSDLARYTTAVDRYLVRLIKKNEVVKVSGGLYCRVPGNRPPHRLRYSAPWSVTTFA